MGRLGVLVVGGMPRWSSGGVLSRYLVVRRRGHLARFVAIVASGRLLVNGFVVFRLFRLTSRLLL